MCDSNIHDELKNIKESVCPFCEQLLVEGDKATDLCCNNQDIEHIEGIRTCINCGLAHGCDYDSGYTDFYENMFKIYRKSVYQRKYHIENVLNWLCFENIIELTLKQRDSIYEVFYEINSILPLVNKTRRRIISVNFILRRIFEMIGISYKKIPISKSKKTLAFYDKYWDSIMYHIGDKIKSIIG